MTARSLVLGGSLVLICLLGFLTVSVMVREGVDVLVLVSLLILALLGFGVLGALTSPPPPDE
jgi:hypothetical protein